MVDYHGGCIREWVSQDCSRTEQKVGFKDDPWVCNPSSGYIELLQEVLSHFLSV